MLQTIEAVIDENGVLRILDSIDLPKMRRVIVTILNEEPSQAILERALHGTKMAILEQKHTQGYAKIPSQKGEFTEWESEQNWGEA
jgi:predicted DNA-binding antitoxin AbrB/MazE fold protein